MSLRVSHPVLLYVQDRHKKQFLSSGNPITDISNIISNSISFTITRNDSFLILYLMNEDEKLSDISPQTRDQLQQNTLSALTLHRLNLIYDFTYGLYGKELFSDEILSN